MDCEAKQLLQLSWPGKGGSVGTGHKSRCSYDRQRIDSTAQTTVEHRNQKEHAMGRMKGLAALLGIAVLMVVVTACGGEATGTPPPTQDIPLTTVIAMGMANEIREIQVDGKKLTVYTKTIARGGADRFVSRIGGDTDIIGMLIDSGADVGPPNGVELKFKGVSAEDVQATISVALATSIVDEVVGTPTPRPALAPTPRPTANPTTIQVPQRPLIRLSHNGQVYTSLQRSSGQLLLACGNRRQPMWDRTLPSLGSP